ncbi:CDP-diacylglycerol diphosphatase [Terriglobus saanensis]|uniref:CDP-diacylglycerol pyrophosphatase n=1 Tax=Terriglobus saanensis (strain ATCC BAA-1853 / DSM 23119 / SP1PR4) TaxID=401053 RepID=E8V0N7_TERSS|nr:CDP-diacylglycerol diphosphatase [Terriglobus saanensis]ADV81100.1 CDP-diacylglycerol diphosphatase [Terriglobus saanensis SP1PR4]
MLNSRSIKYLLALIAVLVSIVIAIVALREKQINKGDVLWQIVHEDCVPDMQANHLASPCVSVDLARGEAAGFVVFKDKQGNTQYLVMPTAKITGIEDPAILEPNATNYFADAWQATALVDQRLHQTLPRTDLSVAINSVSGRSQDQLHLHVDCMQPAVKSALQQVAPQIGTAWQTLPVRLRGDEYRAMWLPGADLDTRNPFRLLADSLSDPAREMGNHTLVLVGAERLGKDGFILLDGKAPALATAISSWLRLGYGAGGKLQDHQCRVASTLESKEKLWR